MKFDFETLKVIASKSPIPSCGFKSGIWAFFIIAKGAGKIGEFTCNLSVPYAPGFDSTAEAERRAFQIFQEEMEKL